MTNVIHVNFGRQRRGRVSHEERAIEICTQAINVLEIDIYRAKALFEQAVFVDPKCWVAHIELGNIARGLGEREGARFRYREALLARPDSYEALFNLGALAYEDRDLREAQKYLRQALDLAPRSKEARELLDDIEEVLTPPKTRRKR